MKRVESGQLRLRLHIQYVQPAWPVKVFLVRAVNVLQRFRALPGQHFRRLLRAAWRAGSTLGQARTVTTSRKGIRARDAGEHPSLPAF